MCYLSSVYFVSQPLHVLSIFVAHQQEVYCIYTTIGMCCAFQLTVCWPTDSQIKKNPTCNELLKSNIAFLESCDIAQLISSKKGTCKPFIKADRGKCCMMYNLFSLKN